MSIDRMRTEEVDALLEVFARIDDADQIYNLLQDLCTPREIADMSQRLHVARMLAAGAHYTDIQEQTGASATTISRVSKCLNYGADGYRSVVEQDGLLGTSPHGGNPEDDGGEK